MSERDEALRRFPPADSKKLSDEQLAYELLESPEFWFDLHRIKDLSGLTYWTQVYHIVDLLSDKDFLLKAKKFYEGFRFPTERSLTGLKNIKDIEETIDLSAIPQTGKMVQRKGERGYIVGYKEYTPKPAWQMTRTEYYEPVTLPQGWKNKGYKPIIEKRKGERGYIVRIITPDGVTLYPTDPVGISWTRSKYEDDHPRKVEAALKQGLPVPKEVLADYPDLTPSVAPQVASMARQFIDEMEKLIRSDPDEFYRKKKLVNQAIKERERGKIKTLPDHSLTDLRHIKKEMDMLYR